MNNIYINGDCLEELKKISKVDYVLTSPPYNRKRNDKYKNYDDTLSDWFGFNKKIIDRLLKITTEYIFYNIQANYYNRVDFYKLIGLYSENIKEIIIWEKSNPMPASGKAITNAVEYFLVLSKKPLKSNTTYTKNHITTSVNSNMPKHHKAVMKQQVCDWFFEKFMQPKKTVLDPLMGLGTTGISAKKYNLNFIGIEKDLEYYNEAVKNIKNEIQQYNKQR